MRLLQLCLKLPNAPILGIEEKKDFSLAITLTMVTSWKIRNNKVFKNEYPNFRGIIFYLKITFYQFQQIEKDKCFTADFEITNLPNGYPFWSKPPLGTIKFNLMNIVPPATKKDGWWYLGLTAWL